jgi:hypothetical protein
MNGVSKPKLTNLELVFRRGAGENDLVFREDWNTSTLLYTHLRPMDFTLTAVPFETLECVDAIPMHDDSANFVVINFGDRPSSLHSQSLLGITWSLCVNFRLP